MKHAPQRPLCFHYIHGGFVVLSISYLLFATVAIAQNNSTQDARLIGQIKNVSAAKLDAALPSISLEQWLRTEAEAGAKLAWEVNDCGEQTGSPGQNPADVPTCVEADAWLKDGRQIVIMIAMPQDAQRKASEQAPPTVFFAQLITTREKITLKQLSDLPAALVRTHEPHKNPEIAK